MQIICLGISKNLVFIWLSRESRYIAGSVSVKEGWELIVYIVLNFSVASSAAAGPWTIFGTAMISSYSYLLFCNHSVNSIWGPHFLAYQDLQDLQLSTSFCLSTGSEGMQTLSSYPGLKNMANSLHTSSYERNSTICCLLQIRKVRLRKVKLFV